METNEQIKYFDRFLPVICFISSIIIFHLIFNEFFPNRNKGIGIDYSYFLPNLLNGYYWYQANGVFEIPWFTPAFCGGVPFLPNPQSTYYSFPQFLTLFIDPLRSVYATFIIFASLGFVGFYLLLRNKFNTTSLVASFGAILFLFNGFYTHRLIIGHLTYHSFMLIPLIAYCLLRSQSNMEKSTRLENLFFILLAGVLISYMLHSGAANFIVPALLSVVGICLFFEIQIEVRSKIWMNLMVAGLIAVCLSATKLTSAIYFISSFPRDQYLLPGIDGFWKSSLFLIQVLSFSEFSKSATEYLVNFPLLFQRHEFEFSITFVPFFVLFIYIIQIIKDRFLLHTWPSPNWNRHQKFKLIILGCILLLPVILNTYTPAWNTFLKDLPYIKNSSSLIRWIAIDIPLIILISSVALDSIKHQYIRYTTFILGMVIIIVLNTINDRTYYHEQSYNYSAINKAYFNARQSGRIPSIKYIGAFVDENNQYEISIIGGNDLMVHGISQLACYEAIFGYRLEKFPIGRIHTGDVMSEKDGFLNIRDPSCYVFGEENYCNPGDHFLVEDKEKVEAFVRYKPFVFSIPFWQITANWINVFALLYVLLISILYARHKIANYTRAET